MVNNSSVVFHFCGVASSEAHIGLLSICSLIGSERRVPTGRFLEPSQTPIHMLYRNAWVASTVATLGDPLGGYLLPSCPAAHHILNTIRQV